MNRPQVKKPVYKDILLFNKALEYLKKHGFQYKCEHCGKFNVVPKTFDQLNSNDWKEIFGPLSRQGHVYRLNRWKQFGWVSVNRLKANTVKIKKLYKIPMKKRLEKLNKYIKNQ